MPLLVVCRYVKIIRQRILNDLAIRYPSFKPKYIQQDHIYDDLPHDMVSADAFGHEDTFEYILENGVPRPEEHLNDIACVTYTLLATC